MQSLLSGCHKNSVKSIRLIQNVARIVQMRISRRDISPDLAFLHQHPKIPLLTYEALNNQASLYFKSLTGSEAVSELDSRQGGLHFDIVFC